MAFRLKFCFFTIIGLCCCWTVSVMAADGNLDKRLTKNAVLTELGLCALDTPTEILDIIAEYIVQILYIDRLPKIKNDKRLSKWEWLKFPGANLDTRSFSALS